MTAALSEADEETETTEQPTDDAAVDGEVMEAEAKPEPKPLSELERDWLEKIKHVNLTVLSAQSEYDRCKADASHAKKRLEELQNRLNDLIADGPNPQRSLPFKDDHDDAIEPDPAEAWRDVPISDVIELTDKQFEKLEDIGVRTVGQFEHLRSGQMPDYPDGLRSVKGVGAKTVDKWEDQVVDWLAANARQADPDEE